jgi:hypothetical protein
MFKRDHLGGKPGLVLWRDPRQDVGNRFWLLIDGQDVPALTQECHGLGPGPTPQINGESGGMVSLSETKDRLPKQLARWTTYGDCIVLTPICPGVARLLGYS